MGSHLVDLLAPQNEVTVFDDFSTGERGNLKHHEAEKAVRIVEGDIRCAKKILEVTRGIDVVYHLAVKNLRESIGDPTTVCEVNVTGTINLCQAALKNRVERFVFVSSSEVYGSGDSMPIAETYPKHPMTPYGASKLAGEAFALSFFHTYKLPMFVVRPFNCYGPRAHYRGKPGEVIPRFIVRAMNGRPPPIFGDGSQTRSFTYVKDIARGVVDVSQCEELVGTPVNVASGEEVSILEIGRTIQEILGKPDLGFDFYPERPGDVRRQRADVSLAARTIQFRPEVGLREGLERQVEWLSQQQVDWGEVLRDDPLFNWETIREGDP